jgi:3',5'-nucleoside bisphosphate phosphatase
MTFRADIHTHSNCSDGTLTPVELVVAAAASSLQGLSITDHDTLEAYSEEVFKKAEEKGILLLPGIEISTRYREHDIHILGYGVDLKDLSLQAFVNEIQKRRIERNRQILLKLANRKMVIHEDELKVYEGLKGGKKVIGRAHIAHMMVQKSYVKSMQEAFQSYLKEGACCFAAGNKFTPAEAILQIHLASGKAVLAHPHFIKSRKLVRDLLEMPFDGIECYYAKLGPDQEKEWVDIAAEKGFIATGGSDFHGEMKPHIPIGCSWVGQEVFFKLLGNSK